MALSLRQLEFARRGRTILGPLSWELEGGQLVGVVGPNGSGKSTLLRLLYAYLTPSAGEIAWQGRALAEWSASALAALIGCCPQEAEPSLDFTAERAIALACHNDVALAAQRRDALPFLQLAPLWERRLSELSGGEKQRVRLARALIMDPPWLVLDEPANHLDLATAWALFDHLRQPRPGGVIVALHDLHFAVRCCDALLVLHQGRKVAFAPPEEALSRTILRQVFGLEGEVRQHHQRAYLDLQGVSP